jgi:adenylate kinase
MHIVILGAPGSGKGTQSKLISDQYNLAAISTGDLLRSAAANKSDPTSRKIAEIISNGMLVSNDLIVKVLQDRLKENDCKEGFILDGFPRSLEQAKLMNEIFNDNPVIINIVIDKDILVKRLLGRFSCKDCGAIYNRFFLETKVKNICDHCGSSNFIYRNDDDEEVIRKRMVVYQEQTKPMVKYYQDNNNNIKSFDGAKNVNVIFAEIKSYLDSIK